VEPQASEQTQILREILKWIKFSGAKEVKSALLAALDSEQKRLIYSLSDGYRGSLEIAEMSGTSDRTVRRYWELWSRQGIVESLKVRGGERYKKSFELEDFGIEVPPPRVSVQAAEPSPTKEPEPEEKR